jgi:hypothetical protein
LTCAASASLSKSNANAGERTMRHVVLLGDSVFDNGAYVIGGRDVITQLKQKLPATWTADLLAVDGSVVADLIRQLARVPKSATHLVVSMGGNDALRESGILAEPATSVAESLLKLSEIHERFAAGFGSALDVILGRKLPTVLCTIYDVRYPDRTQRRIGNTALAVINDRIIREAVGRGVPIIDLRLVCNEEADFANPIEPSERGGDKIAAAILSVLSQHDFSSHRSEIFVR